MTFPHSMALQVIREDAQFVKIRSIHSPYHTNSRNISDPRIMNCINGRLKGPSPRDLSCTSGLNPSKLMSIWLSPTVAKALARSSVSRRVKSLSFHVVEGSVRDVLAGPQC